jgi:hypothetical protein
MNVRMCLYDVPKNEASVLDHLGVFSDTLHRYRQQFTCP